MSKYKIEGGIDFFTELYKSLDKEDNESDEENLCLITNLPLVEKYFKMNCGHKFNYLPLFLDIKNHKQKFNGMEGSSSRLNKNEIRCPYCRKKNNGVLPYYEELGLPKIEGVNYIDPNSKVYKNISSNYKHCQFLTPNPSFDPNGENVSETNEHGNINCKLYLCMHMGSKINFQYNIESGENYGDENHYCWLHKKQMIKKYKKDIADKEKLLAKETKMLAKEELKKQKEEAKQKAKDEKKYKKQLNSTENLILVNNIFDASGNSTIESGCIEVLKTGPNKGKKCGCDIYNNNMCKRHNSLKQKQINNDLIHSN